jgi:hypothetical protein
MGSQGAQGSEPWNPFDCADDRTAFPDSLDAALTPGRGARPAFDVEARARLAPAAIDEPTACTAARRADRCLPREASRRLEAWCQAWFDDQQAEKAERVRRGGAPRSARPARRRAHAQARAPARHVSPARLPARRCSTVLTPTGVA